jgi:inorganic pyrophosphatase
MIAHIGKLIQVGADEFLVQEYKYLGMFCSVFALIIMFAVDIYGGQEFQLYTTVSFLLGCLTSIVSGFIGMRIATYANSRTSYSAITSLGDAFQCAFRAGCVMGFSLTSLGLLVLVILIAVYDSIYTETQAHMFECIAGYGLGGSTVGLFGRVGGGIYTKAADVGADLVGKVENDFAEDSP